MNNQTQLQFLYLFERVGEPLYFSPRGRDSSAVVYNVPSSTITCSEVRDAAQVTRGNFSSSSNARTVAVAAPASNPNLTNIAQLCPRSSLYNYFNSQHRTATRELRQLFLGQQSLDQLLSMASVCRDSPMINCKLWINAFASAMLFHPETRSFRLPAIWEVMPDQFFSSFTMRQAFRQAELPSRDRGLISVENPQTGRNVNPENRLAYYREDIGINSHHWHWHLIYRLEDTQLEGRRKGELFYYMHHAMLARYDAERLGNNLPRVRPLTIDDNPVLREGYFGKLFDTNSGQNWGTRQNDTPLRSLNRTDDVNLPANFRNASLEQLRKWRDRVMEAIDTGVVNGRNNRRIPLDIDILGDMVEASDLSPNPQFYGPDGVHNVGHVLIAFSHDPEYKHIENAGPMNDTTTAMRDPIFYRWHKYIDIIFDTYKQTLPPYQETGGDFPLSWPNVQVTSISVQPTTSGSRPNVLQTFFMKSHVDLSRGLDFTRTDMNRLGPIWLRFSHLNHDPFNYSILVRNSSSSQLRATVRIYLAPRLNEHAETFMLNQQRKLFFEMDKFTQQLRPGDNTITRRSTDSSVTVPWEQTFRDLERGVELPTAQQSICGCGWPQHMLLPRGTPSGQQFDLVVLLTNAEEDSVRGATAPPQGANNNCRESLSFCGRLNQPYPDRKPMGYPFDRNPFTIPDPLNPRGAQITVQTIEQYANRIPNMRTIPIQIRHDASRQSTREDGGPSGIREISGDPSVNPAQPMCPDQGQMPGGTGSSSGGSRGSGSRPKNRTQPAAMETSPFGPREGSVSPSSSPSESRPKWTTATSSSGGRHWSRNPWHSHGSRSRSPSPPGRGRDSRPESPKWGWGG